MREKRRADQASGRNRARLYLRRDLDWLRGFPDPGSPGRWIAVPPGRGVTAAVALDRRVLRRAALAWNRLRGEFRGVLPDLVKDAAGWTECVGVLLERLKPSVHGRAPLAAGLLDDSTTPYRRSTVALAHRLLEREPTLASLVSALSWWCYLEPRDLLPGLRWVERNSAALTVLLGHLKGARGVEVAIRLWQLSSSEGPALVAPLLDWLGDERTYELDLVQGPDYADCLARALEAEGLPPLPVAEPLAPSMVEWLDWLVQQDGGTRRRSLSLLALVQDSSFLDHWQKWWTLLERRRQEAERARLPPERWRDPKQLEGKRRAIGQLARKAPTPFRGGTLFYALETAAHAHVEPRFRALYKALNPLPRRTRMDYLTHWSFVAVASDPEELERFPKFLTAFARYMGRLEDIAERALIPWNEALRSVARWSIGLEQILLEELKTPTQIDAFFAALEEVVRSSETGVSEDEAEIVQELSKILPRPAAVRAHFQALRRLGLSEAYQLDEVISVVELLTGPSHEHLDDVWKALHGSGLRYGEGVALLTLVRRFDRQGLAPVLLRLLLRGDLSRVLRSCHRLALLGSKAAGQLEPHVPAAPPASAVPWAARYPAELHPFICELAGLAAEGERSVDRIIGRSFPAAKELELELAALRRKRRQLEETQLEVAGQEGDSRAAGRGETAGGRVDPLSSVKRRIANLERRRDKPPAVTPRVLTRSRERLQRAVDRAILARWDEQLDAPLLRRLSSLFEPNSVPAWALAPDVVPLLAPIGQQSQTTQQLARRLLRARSGEPPWDLRDDPRNRTFLDQLEARHIATGPWVDGVGVVERAGANGRTVTLALEDDPLEIFVMGAPFKTCVSPGLFNYSSVFADAADINKRVLYARDEKGGVVGRCLLGLTDAGGIVTFHPYCHDPALGFDGLVREFVGDLARRMGSVVLPAGSVSELLSTNWYDDGPRDLTGAFPCLQEDSPLRTSIARLEPGEALAALREAFDPLPVDELTLPLFLLLPELDQNPALVVPLMPLLRRARALPDTVVIRAAALLVGAGNAQLARREFESRLVHYLIEIARRYPLDFHVLDLLRKLSPSRALAVLRRTRPPGVRSWQDETYSPRILAAGLAHRDLHRRAAAAELFRHGVKLAWDSETKKPFQDQLAALATEPGPEGLSDS